MITLFLVFHPETEECRCSVCLFRRCSDLGHSCDCVAFKQTAPCTKPICSLFHFPFPRYQPEQPNLAYQMARTMEETDNNESVSTSESQAGFLPEEEEKCSLKAILCPSNSDPSKFSGSVVNISTFIIGKQWAVSQRGGPCTHHGGKACLLAAI